MTYGCEDVEIVRNPDPDARSRGEARLLRHQPWLWPSQPHRRGDQPRSSRLAGRHSLAPQPVPPLAGAVDSPGGADRTRLGRRRGQSAGRQHGNRWPGDPGTGRPGACRGHGPGRRRARWLRDERVAALLCDAPAVPLVAARRAGIPGLLLANFTWADIYAPYARVAGEHAKGLVAELRRAYRQATTVFRAEPALRMAWLPGQVNVGMVANPGRDRRKELRGLLGLSSKEKLIYFYVGRYGQNDLDWGRLEAYAAKGVHFVGYHSAPAGPLKNLHLLSPSEWYGSDLIASTDALVAKAGYGTVCEAMAGNTPIIYPPRRGFSEFRRSIDRSGHGAEASRFLLATSENCGWTEPWIEPSILALSHLPSRPTAPPGSPVTWPGSVVPYPTGNLNSQQARIDPTGWLWWKRHGTTGFPRPMAKKKKRGGGGGGGVWWKRSDTRGVPRPLALGQTAPANRPLAGCILVKKTNDRAVRSGSCRENRRRLSGWPPECPHAKGRDSKS